MRRLALVTAALALVAAAPASAQEVHWASSAVASSQYSDQNWGGLANPVFPLAAPVENAAFTLLGGAVGPLVDIVLCNIFNVLFGGSPCVPDDPAALAAEVAEGAAGIPGAAPGVVSALPGQLVPAAEAFPGNLENALTTTPDSVKYGSWSAWQATGAPNTYPSCGDIGTAWAPLSNGPEPEFLAVSYDPPVANATRVDIYETNIGGFVTSVEIILATGETTPVFVGPDTTVCAGGVAGILSIPLSGENTVAGVVIHTQADGWEEIDAVAVVN